MKDLTDICQQVWMQRDISAKKSLLMQAIASFKYKEKADTFRKQIEKITNANELDRIASNLILNKTDKVVSPLKR